MAIPGIGYSDSVTKLAYLAYQIMTTEYKLSAEQACGVLGNMWAESGFQPSVVEHGNGIGWGLFQLSFERRKPAEDWCDKNGYQKGDNAKKVALQIKYVFEIESPQWFENGSYVKALTGIKRRKTVDDACKGWLYCWERPGIPRYSERIGFARKCLNSWEKHAGEGVKGLEGISFGDGEDEGPKYVSFEEALIKNFKSGKKAAPQGIAIHEILTTSSAKSAKDTLLKGGNVGIAGAQFHLVCDSKDAFLVVDLADRVSHVQRTNKNFSNISNPNSALISIGVCGGVNNTGALGKAAQVAAEVCHLLSLSPGSVHGSYKFDGVADPSSWKDQEGTIIGEEGEFSNMAFQRAVAAALENDIGGILEATGQGGGSGRGSMKKVIEVAQKWHEMNSDCYYDSPGIRAKGPHKGPVDCSGFVMGCIQGAGYNVPIWDTPSMCRNCKPLEGAANSDQCLGGKNAFFRQIKPSEAQKGDIVVAGGLAGSGPRGHTGFVWGKYKGGHKGGNTPFLNSGGNSEEGRKQPNLGPMERAMWSLNCFVFMTINKGEDDRKETNTQSQISKKKKDKNVGIKFNPRGGTSTYSLNKNQYNLYGEYKIIDWDKTRLKLSNNKWYDKDIQDSGQLFITKTEELGIIRPNKKIQAKIIM